MANAVRADLDKERLIKEDKEEQVRETASAAGIDL